MGKKIKEGRIMAQAQRVVREYVQRGHIERTVQTMPIAAKRLRVAAYGRVSTDDEDQLNSYKTQVEYYTAYIQSKPEWEFVGIYADEGITGTKLKKRKRFQDLIRDALDGKIDLILVKNVSRFARNTVDSLSTVRELREKGVKIFFEQQNIDSLDPKCDMMLSIYSSLAEEESRSISTNVRWGHDKRIAKGEVTFNFKNLYGYTQDENKVISIKESEAEVVRDIYHNYLIGYSISEISRSLVARGIKSPFGRGRWSFSTVKNILDNEKYIGDALLRKTYQRDFLAERRVKNTGQAPQKYVENNHPAIIDRLTWEAVQAESERRSNLRSTAETGRGRYDMRYVFSGIIECGECGSMFRRHNNSYRGKVERVWTCKEHLKGNRYCPQLSVKEDYLESLFVATLNGLIADRDRILQIVEKSVSEAILETADGTSTAQDIVAVDADIERLQSKMLELSKQRTRRELNTEEYNAKSSEVMGRLDALFTKRDGLVSAQSEGALSESRRGMIAELLGNMREQNGFDRDVFCQLIEAVRVKSREDILFIFKNGTAIKADTSAAGMAA
jgi:DNA invertase Pin-like site-specific DNA recombinase